MNSAIRIEGTEALSLFYAPQSPIMRRIHIVMKFTRAICHDQIDVTTKKKRENNMRDCGLTL